MKTQVLRLEPHDDYVSVRDKMNWIQTRRILIIWPEQANILSRKIDLVLLKRKSIMQGAQLAIITSHPDVRNQARELNIPIFADLNKAQRSRWRTDHRYRIDRLSKPRGSPNKSIAELRDHLQKRTSDARWAYKSTNRVLMFSIGVFSILFVAGILFPSAIIILSPHHFIRETIIEVRASPVFHEINLSGAIPARYLSVIVEGQSSLPTTGQVTISQEFASGSVLVTNLTNKEINITEGTIIRSSTEKGTRFAVTQSESLPPQAGAKVSLSVRSLVPGVSGNLPGGSLTILEGSNSQNVALTNPLPTRGGTEVNLPAPSGDDEEKLLRQLEQRLLQSAIQLAQEQINPNDLIVENSIIIDQVLQEHVDPVVGHPGELITIFLSLECKILIVSGDDILELVDAVQDTSLPPGLSLIPESTQIDHITRPKLGVDNFAHWRMSAKSTAHPIISEQNIIRLVLGVPDQKVNAILSTQFQLQEPARIRITPGWWPRMPYLPFRISVAIRN